MLKLRIKYPLTNNIIFNLKDTFNLKDNNLLMEISKAKFEADNIASCIQTHSDHVQYIDKPGIYENTDGLITNVKNNIFLMIQTADCVPIFILDNNKGIIGLVHSGWKGTSKSIILSAISIFSDYGSNINDIHIYLGPCIKSCCYEVKNDVAQFFEEDFIMQNNNKLFLSLESKIKSDLLNIGIQNSNILISEICTYENKKFCSYRRDKDKAGRMYSIIG